MNYYNQILKHKAFKENHFYVLWNAIILYFFLIFKIKFILNISTKFINFKLKFMPLDKKMGGRGIFLYREKIEPLMEYGLKFIQKNDVCIDAGANQGIYSIPFAKIAGSKGKVIAIEPMKYAQEILKNNSKLNNLRNIKIFNGVISDKNKKEILDLTTGVGSASIVRDFGKKKILKVVSITIDSLVKKYRLKRINFIKMDIEGSELSALKGAKKTLKQFKPIICLESDVKNFSKIYNFLKKFSYKAYLFNNNGSLFKIKKITKDQSNIFFYR
jgi:FkbM family methyltransferase